MSRTLAVVAVCAVCIAFCGCAGIAWTPVIPPAGFIYTQYKAPLDVDFDATPVPMKKGTASTMCVLGLVAVGDASARAAAQDGGITRIEHADYDTLNVLGVYSKFTIIVYGE